MNILIFLFFVVFQFFFGCAAVSSFQNNDSKTAHSDLLTSIKIVNWNLQTFFDAQTSGNEYSEFKQSSNGWGTDAYNKRLDRLCEVINSLDADIFVMEEIENEGILYDISNRLAVNSWKKDKIYDYGCFAIDEGSSIGCAVLSKYMLSNLKVHSLDIRTESTKQPLMRPLMEVLVFVDSKPLVLFVNHWKSMSGGEEKTEIWRNWQESVLGSRFSSKSLGSSAIFACGDFNRDISNFLKNNSCLQTDSGNPANIFLRYVASQKTGLVGVYSPWITDGKTLEQGSYYFNNNWNHLDHFFCCGKAFISSFSVETNGLWANENKVPIGYKIYTGEGYSDHLPISCTVQF